MLLSFAYKRKCDESGRSINMRNAMRNAIFIDPAIQLLESILQKCSGACGITHIQHVYYIIFYNNEKVEVN